MNKFLTIVKAKDKGYVIIDEEEILVFASASIWEVTEFIRKAFGDVV